MTVGRSDGGVRPPPLGRYRGSLRANLIMKCPYSESLDGKKIGPRRGRLLQPRFHERRVLPGLESRSECRQEQRRPQPPATRKARRDDPGTFDTRLRTASFFAFTQAPADGIRLRTPRLRHSRGLARARGRGDGQWGVEREGELLCLGGVCFTLALALPFRLPETLAAGPQACPRGSPKARRAAGR